MRRSALAAALAASAFAAWAAPAVAAPELPPRDVVRIEGLEQACPPDGPCGIGQIQVYVDKTYPNRLIAWVKDQTG